MSLLLLAAALLRPSAGWADPQEIEEGEPVTLEDAQAEETGRLALQWSGSYARVDLGQTSSLVEQGPTFKLGLGHGLQLSINPNYDVGSGPGRDSGFELTDLKAQFNQQGVYLPTFALDVFQSVPFGAGQNSSGYVIRGIVSKWLGGPSAPRLHLNISDIHVSTPGLLERGNQIQVAAGGSALFTPTDAVVADVVHGQSDRVAETETYLEAGWSRDLPADWTCQLGYGKQVEGKGFRVFFAVEKEVQLF